MARVIMACLAALLAALPAAAGASDLVLDSLVLDSQSGFVVPVVINGATLRLRVDPAASGLTVLNPAAARRARLRPEIGPPIPFIPGAYPRKSYARVGPIGFTGRTSRAVAAVAGRRAELRLIWFERDVVDGADGLISIANLPFDRVTLRLAPTRPDEAPVALRLDFSPEMGLYFAYGIGERVVPIQFSIWRQENMSTAAAGALIARSHAGAWGGGYARRTVNFGVDRPVRPMALGRPIDLAGIMIGHFLVRTGDYRGGYALPAEAADPDEIVVVGDVSRQAPRLNLTLGRNQLSRCSTISWERGERRLTLACALNPPLASAPGAPPAPPGGSTREAPAVLRPPRH